jgi:hypothetical protein
MRISSCASGSTGDLTEALEEPDILGVEAGVVVVRHHPDQPEIAVLVAQRY